MPSVFSNLLCTSLAFHRVAVSILKLASESNERITDVFDLGLVQVVLNVLHASDIVMTDASTLDKAV